MLPTLPPPHWTPARAR